MPREPVLQDGQFLAKGWQSKKRFYVGLPDLPDCRRKEAVNLELVKFEDGVDDFMGRSALFWRHLHAASSASLEERSRWQAPA